MMATSKSHFRPQNTHSFPVHFEGGLHSSVRAELVAELMKYILYERQQISMTYDNYKKHSVFLQQQQEFSGRRRAWSSKQKELKKMLDILEKIDKTIQEIKNAFECCPEIKLAAVVLGPTVVSPKEVYKIELPPLNPEADNLSMKNCVKSLFREIVISDPLGNAKQIHPTNAVLLLYAPRDSHISWFCPKPLYKLPSRGEHFYINLLSSCGEGSHELTREFAPAELSGFEFLDSSSCDPCNVETNENLILNSASSESSVSSDFVCIDSDMMESVGEGLHPSDSNTTETTENASFTNTLTKSNSVSSLLSNSSVMKGSESFSNSCSMDISEDLASVSQPDSQYMWFQTPLVIKGFRSKLFRL